MVVKNRSTPKDAAFWDHVETVAAQARESRQQMSEQRAVPEIPEDLANLHSAATDDSTWGGRRIRTLIEEIAQGRDWYLGQIKIVNDANATLTAERDSAKRELAELLADTKVERTKYEALKLERDTERGLRESSEQENDRLRTERDGIRRQSDKWMIDFGIECAKTETLTQENAALKAQVERLSAPVSDDEPDLCEGCDKPLRDDEGHETEDMVMLCDDCWQELLDDLGWHSEECPCNTCIAARTAPAKETE